MKLKCIAIAGALVVLNMMAGADVINKEIIKPIEKPEPKVIEKVYYDIPLSRGLQDYTRGLCEAHGIEFEMILAIMNQESDYKHKTKSKNNGELGSSIGIMQVNENNIDWCRQLTGLGKKFNINNIYHNIFSGILIYKSCRHDWEWGYTGWELDIRSLNSYNMGTRKYVRYIRRTGTINWKYGREVMQYKKEVLEKCKVIVQVEDIKD